MSRAGGPAQLDVRIESKSYRSASGGRLDVLRDLKFAIPVGAVAALVGPSGCGKTTLLRIITGIDRDFTGTVSLPEHGRLGMVFQEPRLLPWRTVEENVRLGAPEAVDIVLINRPELPPVGAGESSIRPVAAAIANAVFDASGVRLRRAPLTPERLKPGLA